MDQSRLKPVCLIIIDSFDINYLSNDMSNFSYLKNLAENFPFFVLRSTDINVDYPWNSYLELGTGLNIKDEFQRISLSSIINDAGLKQLYVAESEMYGNILFFFSNKERLNDQKITKIIISETKSDDYIKNTDMMAGSITSKFLKEIDRKIYDFALISYPNLLNDNIEEVSQILSPKIKSIVDTVLAFNGAVFISSNSSKNKDNNFVPLLMISREWKDKSFIDHNHFKQLNKQSISGNTYDIAATILKVMGLEKPTEMKGSSLI
ncbi:MAG: hypothetical protein PHH83_04145 [Patescibacteria group bacterium]|nr:hypothetical protein [Patescibacteria group bacterium]